MNKTATLIKESLLKRQEAYCNFMIKKEEYRLIRKQITKEIEEAKILWMKTAAKLPKSVFEK